MKAYIYFIINKITGERYVGQTTNFARRKNEHLSQLKENIHPNKKLQSAWNKYKESNFVITKIQYDDISKEELNYEEIRYIKQYNSFDNGYNLTLGGDGGDTRSKLNFEQFCFAYFGNKKYKGMTARTGKYLGVDSSCISSIKNEKSYDSFRQKAKKLTIEEQNNYIVDFEKKLNIANKPPWTKRETLDNQTSYEILCVVSTYGSRIEKAVLSYFNLTKGFVYHLITGKGRQEIKIKYRDSSKEERQKIGREKFKEWQLQSFSKIKIKEEYKDLFSHYGLADLKQVKLRETPQSLNN